MKKWLINMPEFITDSLYCIMLALLAFATLILSIDAGWGGINLKFLAGTILFSLLVIAANIYFIRAKEIYIVFGVK